MIRLGLKKLVVNTLRDGDFHHDVVMKTAMRAKSECRFSMRRLGDRGMAGLSRGLDCRDEPKSEA
jgi:hypothetical protein